MVMENSKTLNSRKAPDDRGDPASREFLVKAGTDSVGTAGCAVQDEAVVSVTGAIPNDKVRPHAWLYAVPFDRWSRELDELLVNFCKRGRDGQREAMLAIRATHPEISSNIIWARIVYLR